jgi:hypothetical protein
MLYLLQAVKNGAAGEFYFMFCIMFNFFLFCSLDYSYVIFITSSQNGAGGEFLLLFYYAVFIYFIEILNH